MTRATAPRFSRITKAYGRLAAAIAVAGGVVATTAAGCGVDDGIVGGDCAGGYTDCSLKCVDLQTDPNNCGACGHVCPPGVGCSGGVCEGPLDGSLPDGEAEGDGSPDVDGTLPIGYCDANSNSIECKHRDSGSDGSNNGDGSNGDGSNEEGGGDGSNGDGASYPDGCAPPFDTPDNCGTCGNACEDGGVCSLVDGGFMCEPLCTAPLVDCSGQCVNLARDPNNCGMCGKVCPSEYCYLATCQGTVAGSIMVIGHDFLATPVPSASAPPGSTGDQQAKLLTNSVFYNPGNVVLYSFEAYANTAAGSAVANGLAILSRYASTGQLAVTHVTDPTYFTDDQALNAANVILIWDQDVTPPPAPGTIAALGTSWAPHLSSYVQQGGIVIALDGDQGAMEMDQLITNAALLAITAHGPVVAGSPADVPAFGTSIARGMTSVYTVDANSAWFTTSEAPGTNTIFVANVQQDSGTLELLAVQKIVN